MTFWHRLATNLSTACREELHRVRASVQSPV
jgi:hypothetical protein